MSALEGGEEVAPLREFRTAWHPKERRVVMLQFGASGIYGSGTMVSTGGGRHRMDQEFFLPDGNSFRSGHEDEEADDLHHSHSVDILSDGSWQKGRSYSWQRTIE